MKGSLMWRGMLILASVLLAVALLYPPSKKIILGLDLRGGMHLVLQVHTEDALRAETDSDMATLIQRAEDEGMSGLKGQRVGDDRFQIAGYTPESHDTLSTVISKQRYDQRWDISDQGNAMIFKLKAAEANQIRDSAVTQAKQTIENRIDAFGVAEMTVQSADNHRIVIQLPGLDDQDRVRRLIKNTAFLEFRIVEYPRGATGAPTKDDILKNFNGRLPDNLEILEGDVREKGTNAVVGKQYFAVEKRRTVTGRDLSNARPSSGEFNRPIVQFMLKPQGSVAFAELTGKNIGKGLAIVLDGRVVTAPVIHARISDSGIIEGDFTQQEVQDLSTVLKSGALPAGITYLEERTVGPALGRDSIQKGLLAAVVGTALVMVTMLIIYNLSGVNAIMALLLNVLILFGGMGMFHSTLTLPGIAGIILTIGMAVDANVLVFERVREELRAGRTVRSAIDLGFDRAFTSIIDTHVTTMVSALFLFQFGTGAIKGFAVTLFIGLLASIFTAVFVSHWIFDLVLSRRRMKALSI